MTVLSGDSDGANANIDVFCACGGITTAATLLGATLAAGDSVPLVRSVQLQLLTMLQAVCGRDICAHGAVLVGCGADSLARVLLLGGAEDVLPPRALALLTLLMVHIPAILPTLGSQDNIPRLFQALQETNTGLLRECKTPPAQLSTPDPYTFHAAQLCYLLTTLSSGHPQSRQIMLVMHPHQRRFGALPVLLELLKSCDAPSNSRLTPGHANLLANIGGVLVDLALEPQLPELLSKHGGAKVLVRALARCSSDNDSGSDNSSDNSSDDYRYVSGVEQVLRLLLLKCLVLVSALPPDDASPASIAAVRHLKHELVGGARGLSVLMSCIPQHTPSIPPAVNTDTTTTTTTTTAAAVPVPAGLPAVRQANPALQVYLTQQVLLQVLAVSHKFTGSYIAARTDFSAPTHLADVDVVGEAKRQLCALEGVKIWGRTVPLFSTGELGKGAHFPKASDELFEEFIPHNIITDAIQLLCELASTPASSTSSSASVSGLATLSIDLEAMERLVSVLELAQCAPVIGSRDPTAVPIDVVRNICVTLYAATLPAARGGADVGSPGTKIGPAEHAANCNNLVNVGGVQTLVRLLHLVTSGLVTTALTTAVAAELRLNVLCCLYNITAFCDCVCIHSGNVRPAGSVLVADEMALDCLVQQLRTPTESAEGKTGSRVSDADDEDDDDDEGARDAFMENAAHGRYVAVLLLRLLVISDSSVCLSQGQSQSQGQSGLDMLLNSRDSLLLLSALLTDASLHRDNLGYALLSATADPQIRHIVLELLTYAVAADSTGIQDRLRDCGGLVQLVGAIRGDTDPRFVLSCVQLVMLLCDHQSANQDAFRAAGGLESMLLLLLHCSVADIPVWAPSSPQIAQVLRCLAMLAHNSRPFRDGSTTATYNFENNDNHANKLALLETSVGMEAARRRFVLTATATATDTAATVTATATATATATDTGDGSSGIGGASAVVSGVEVLVAALTKLWDIVKAAQLVRGVTTGPATAALAGCLAAVEACVVFSPPAQKLLCTTAVSLAGCTTPGTPVTLLLKMLQPQLAGAAINNEKAELAGGLMRLLIVLCGGMSPVCVSPSAAPGGSVDTISPLSSNLGVLMNAGAQDEVRQAGAVQWIVDYILRVDRDDADADMEQGFIISAGQTRVVVHMCVALLKALLVNNTAGDKCIRRHRELTEWISGVETEFPEAGEIGHLWRLAEVRRRERWAAEARVEQDKTVDSAVLRLRTLLTACSSGGGATSTNAPATTTAASVAEALALFRRFEADATAVWRSEFFVLKSQLYWQLLQQQLADKQSDGHGLKKRHYAAEVVKATKVAMDMDPIGVPDSVLEICAKCEGKLSSSGTSGSWK